MIHPFFFLTGPGFPISHYFIRPISTFFLNKKLDSGFKKINNTLKYKT